MRAHVLTDSVLHHRDLTFPSIQRIVIWWRPCSPDDLVHMPRLRPMFLRKCPNFHHLIAFRIQVFYRGDQSVTSYIPRRHDADKKYIQYVMSLSLTQEALINDKKFFYLKISVSGGAFQHFFQMSQRSKRSRPRNIFRLTIEIRGYAQS